MIPRTRVSSGLSDALLSCYLAFLTLLLVFIIPSPGYSSSAYEEKIVSTIQDIQNSDVGSSIDNLNQLVKKYPNSKLGHLVLADLLASRSGSRKLIDQHNSDQDQLTGLRDEIQHRWKYKYLQNPALAGLIPSNIVQTSPAQQYVMMVDASNARMYVYENMGQEFELVDSYYMTVGKSGMGKLEEGDLRTPIGVYFVTSYLPGKNLPARYGPGAYPINYPNEYDKLAKRTGYGIWIHGTEPENYNRVPWASDGCVSLSNDEFIDIQKYVSTDGTTPVIIANKFKWVTPDQLRAERSKFKKMLSQWVRDWESLDTNQYLTHYSTKGFKTRQYDYDSWAKHKRRVNKSKSFIKIGVSNLSIFTYPGEREMVEISFDQTYVSDNYESVSVKKQYWQKETNGDWKIIYEG